MAMLGWKFAPNDSELIHLLELESRGDYQCPDFNMEHPYGNLEPWEMFSKHGKEGKKVAYFSTPLKRMNRTCNPNFSRTVGTNDGVWKPLTNLAEPIHSQEDPNIVVGWKKTLRYYNRSDPDQSGQWIIKEYSRNNPKPEDLVVCRIKNQRN